MFIVIFLSFENGFMREMIGEQIIIRIDSFLYILKNLFIRKKKFCYEENSFDFKNSNGTVIRRKTTNSTIFP